MMLWKDIKDYEGYYQVSNTSLVRGLDRYVPDKTNGQRFIRGRYMKLTNCTGRGSDEEYLVVNLRKNSTSMVIPVHRLVAEAFIPNTYNLPTVNHKDGNKHNNTVDNFEWATYTDNNVHALQNKLRTPRGCAVYQIMEDNSVVKYCSITDASRKTGIGRGSISHCVNGRISTAGGYKWVYVEKCNDYLSNESTTDDELPLEVQERI